MSTFTISSGICYLDIYDSATVGMTGSTGATVDIPYLILGDDVFRVTETPTTNMTCSFETKDFDMSDQAPAYQNLNKTIDRVQLEYVDKTSDTPVSISISTDGGQTWAGTTSRSIGAGTGLTAVADFWFLPITGKMARMRLESTSTTKNFVWTGAYIHYYPRSEYFEIA
jgi:hypothetical protein